MSRWRQIRRGRECSGYREYSRPKKTHLVDTHKLNRTGDAKGERTGKGNAHLGAFTATCRRGRIFLSTTSKNGKVDLPFLNELNKVRTKKKIIEKGRNQRGYTDQSRLRSVEGLGTQEKAGREKTARGRSLGGRNVRMDQKKEQIETDQHSAVKKETFGPGAKTTS